MTSQSRTVSELRNEQYSYHGMRFPYVNQWTKTPYTWFKARFYMEASALLLSILLKTGIKPNSITILYCLCGIAGGILLAIPNTVTIIVAVVIFFSKGILDWSDGHLARIRGQESLTGHILDMYGARVNSLGLQIGLGFYVAHKGGAFYYYLIPLIPLFYLLSITDYSYSVLFKALPDLLRKKDLKTNTQCGNNGGIASPPRWHAVLASFLDDRARSVDFILLLIVAELVYPQLFVTWTIFILLVAKRLIICAGKFYLVARRSWVDDTVTAELNEILRAVSPEQRKAERI